MESAVSAGGAAQLGVPQRGRGCAAVLCFLAVRSCKAPPCSSLASGRRPFINSLARLLRRHPPCSYALRPFQRVAPCTSKPMLAAPAPWCPTFAINPPSRHVVVGAPQDCSGTCDGSSAVAVALPLILAVTLALPLPLILAVTLAVVVSASVIVRAFLRRQPL